MTVVVLEVDISQRLGGLEMLARARFGGGVTGIFGRSGSGKTSLLRAIAGLSMPNQGRLVLGDTVLFDSAKAVHVPPARRRIGYVFQDPRLFPHLTVTQNLDFGARYAPRPVPQAERVKIIDMLGIDALLTRRPGALSGGEQARVALGRALMAAPRLLLLDEPLAALDQARKAEILPYLDHLVRETGVPILYVSHDLDEITRLAQDFAVMREGHLAAHGPLADMLSDPALVRVIGVQEAGAVLTGRLSAQSADGLSRVDLSASQLFLPRIDAPLGTQVHLRVRAQDVMLAMAPPEGLSAQNILPAVITALQSGTGPGVAVGLRCGSDRLVARITARACERLGLVVGQQVWAILKASATPPAAIWKS